MLMHFRRSLPLTVFLSFLLLVSSYSFGKLSTPVLYSPANNTVDAPTGMQLEVKSESVTLYAFEYSEDPSMKDATRIEVIRDTYYTRTWLNKLKRNTTYYWRVKSISKTDSSDWTSTYNFKTAARLKRYYPKQDKAKISTSFLYLSCYRAAQFDSFEFQFDTSANFNSADIRKVIMPDTFNWFYIESIQKNFRFGNTYFWRVRGLPDNSQDWTDTGSFVIFDTITPKYPSTAFLQNVKIGFEFTGVSYQQPFQVQIDTSAHFNSPLLIDTFALEGTQQYNPIPFSVGNLNYETYYYYRVRAISEVDSSRWSYSAFTTKGLANDFMIAENYADPMVSLKVRTLIEGSNTYEIQLDTTPNFNSPEKQIFFDENGIDTAYDLFFGKIYYTRGRPVHAKDSGEWTRVRPINILKFPSTRYPYTTSVVQITDSLQFATNTGMDGFQIQVTSQNQFDSALFLDTIISNVNPKTNHLIKGLRFRFSTQYLWRIRAWHDRDTSIWSTPLTFNTVSAPTPLRPFDSDFLGNGTTVPFSWEPLKGGVKYQVLLDTSKNFDSKILLDTLLDSTSFTLSNLLFRPLYYWKIRAITADDTSDWSKVWVFKILSVRLNTPRNNITNLTLYSLDWNSIDGTTGYILELDTAAAFTNPFRVQDTVRNSFFHYFMTVPDMIGFQTKAYWRVKLFHETDTSEWSPVWNFTTIARRAPLLTSPADSAINVPIFGQLKWQAYSGASSYAIHYGDKADFSNAVKTTSTGTTLNVSLKANTRYYWKVRGRNSDGNEFYDFSETWTFTTDSGIPAPKLISPVNNAENQALNVIFSWGKFTPSTSYRVEISQDATFNSGVVTKNSTTGTAYFTHLQSGTQYYWRVKTFNGALESPWSTVWRFGTVEVNANWVLERDGVRISPNPSSGIFTLSSLSGVARIAAVMDVQGRVVRNCDGESNPLKTIDLRELASGIYYLKIATAAGEGVITVVKE